MRYFFSKFLEFLTSIAESVHVDFEEWSIHGEEITRKASFRSGDFVFQPLLNQFGLDCVGKHRGWEHLQ